MENKLVKQNKYILQKSYKNKLRFYYFDYLRIISAFGVILIHVSTEYVNKLNVSSYKWKIAYYYYGLSRFGVPIFFMISGALFLNRDLSYEKLYKKYINRIFIHLLFYSIIYSLVNTKLDIKKKLIKIIKGHYHLWYLYATIGLYINIPFTREITKNKKLLNYFIFIYFIFIFIIPNYIPLLLYYSKDTFKLLKELKDKLKLSILANENFYFIFGNYLNNKKDIKKEFCIIIYIAGLIGLVFTTKISHILSFIRKEKIRYFTSNYLNIFCYSISIFLFFKRHFNEPTNTRKIKLIQNLAKYTFGIYLIHPLILETIKKKLNIFYLDFNIIFLIPIITLLIFILSLVISIILDRIPLIGKFLV